MDNPVLNSYVAHMIKTQRLSKVSYPNWVWCSETSRVQPSGRLLE